MAGVGLLISVSSRSAVQAQGTAVFAWFAFVLLYDLLLIGTLAASGMPAEWLAGALVEPRRRRPRPRRAGPRAGSVSAGSGRRLHRDAILSRGGRRPAARGPRLLDNGPGRLRKHAICPAAASPRRPRPGRNTGAFIGGGGQVLMIRKVMVVVAALAFAGAAAACSADSDPVASASTAAKAAAPAAKSVTPEMLEKGKSLYQANCTACHGESGKGDGPGAGVLKPPPRDHTDYAYMSALTDKEIADVIRMGGAIKGRPLMPSHPAITARQWTRSWRTSARSAHRNRVSLEGSSQAVTDGLSGLRPSPAGGRRVRGADACAGAATPSAPRRPVNQAWSGEANRAG